jgi:hypothetical protein
MSTLKAVSKPPKNGNPIDLSTKKDRVQIEDGRTYIITFKTKKARIESTILPGWITSTIIDDKHVKIVKGWQIKELDKLEIPYQFFTPVSIRNGDHKVVAQK